MATYMTEVAHCWSCQTDQMYYVWFAISKRHLFWPEIGTHVKSATPSTTFSSTLIDASNGPVPRFWTLVFCQETLIPKVLTLPGNLRVLLTTDHQVSWAVTAPIFSTLDYTRFAAWIARWGRSRNRKENCWRILAANAIFNLTLTLPLYSYDGIRLTYSCREGTARCFCSRIVQPVVCKTRDRNFFYKIRFKLRISKRFVRQLIIYGFRSVKFCDFF